MALIMLSCHFSSQLPPSKSMSTFVEDALTGRGQGVKLCKSYNLHRINLMGKTGEGRSLNLSNVRKVQVLLKSVILSPCCFNLGGRVKRT